ncbi:hypothetical protein TWF718_009678 [Orbilia javanica]|uniref:Carbohydrate kinase PfkB domain-containing protein n=1 Tax=Orbilia javanica TaxID=47235 RepID=A0AAN8MMW7_9PEZI
MSTRWSGSANVGARGAEHTTEYLVSIIMSNPKSGAVLFSLVPIKAEDSSIKYASLRIGLYLGPRDTKSNKIDTIVPVCSSRRKFITGHTPHTSHILLRNNTQKDLVTTVIYNKCLVMGGYIAVIGALNVDLIFTSEKPLGIGESINTLNFAKMHGGKGANTAVAAHRFCLQGPETGSDRTLSTDIDIQVALHGAVGGDEYGRLLKEELAEAGIDVSGVDTLPSSVSGICCVLVDAKTGESSNIAYQGANINWRPSAALMDRLQGSKGPDRPDLIILHLDTSLEVVRKILKTAAEFKIDTLLNPSPVTDLGTEIYHNLTHLILNEPEAMRLSRVDFGKFPTKAAWQKAGMYFIKLGVIHVVITLGAKGAYYITADRSGLVSLTENVNVIDSTGAGDTFTGTYAVEYVRKKRLGIWNVTTAVERACKAATATVGRLGAHDLGL